MSELRSRPATISDVAEQAGVSRAAVSKVIRGAYGVSDSMRERVGAAIAELDYRPSSAARALRGRSWTIGIEMPVLSNPFLAKLVEGATLELHGSPFQLIVAPAAPEEVEGQRALQVITDHNVDGVIAVSPLVEVAWLERLAERTPVVMIGRHDRTDAYDTVTTDDAAGALLALEHLHGRGHRRIAHLSVRTASIAPENGSPHSARIEAYRAFMLRHGIEEHIEVLYGGLEGDPVDAVVQLLDRPDRPTAIFAGSDFMGLDAMRAMDRLGLGPGDVAIVGFDGIDIASHPRIGLSTVDQDGILMGRLAVRRLLERLEGRTVAEHSVIEPRLVVRDSSR